MPTLTDVINSFELADKTKENLRGTYKKLMTDYDDEPYKAFTDLEHIVKVANTISNERSKSSFYSNIQSIAKHYKLWAEDKDLETKTLIDDDTYKLFNVLAKASKEEEEKIIKEQKYKVKYTLKDLFDIMETYPEDSIEYLFFATSLLIPPRRRDWGDAKFYTTILPFMPSDTKCNNVVIVVNDDNEIIEEYIDHNDVSLSFNVFKTFKDLGQYKKTLSASRYEYMTYLPHLNPNKLRTLLVRSYINNPRGYIFMNGKKNWKSFTKKIYGKYEGLTQNTFRHAFAQEVFNPNRIPESVLEKIAYDFGDGNVNTMRRYSTILTDEETDEEIDEKLYWKNCTTGSLHSDSDNDEEEEEEEEDVIENDSIETKIIETIIRKKAELADLQQQINQLANDLDVYKSIKKKYI